MKNERFETGYHMSRRDLLFGPVRTVRKALREASSENSITDDEILRDNVVEKVGEGISLVAIGITAFKGSKDQIVTYQVDSESKQKDLKDFVEKLGTIEALKDVFTDVSVSLSSLRNAWTDAYYKSSMEIYTDSDGDIKTRTVWNWDEPQELIQSGIDHYKIGDKDEFTGLCLNGTRNIETKGPQSFDLSKDGGSIYYPEKSVDAKGQNILAIALYGLVGTGFVFYEEGLKRYTEAEFAEPIVNDTIRIKRRTFLKALVAVPLAIKVREFQRKFAKENKDLLKDIEKNTKTVLSRMDVGDEENFKRFFGGKPMEMRAKLVETNIMLKAGLNSGYDGRGFLVYDNNWENVRSRMDNTRLKSEKAIADFDKYFLYNKETGVYTIPASLTDITKSLWATQEITKYVNSKSTRINIRHLVDAGIMGLGLLVATVINEGVILPISDNLISDN